MSWIPSAADTIDWLVGKPIWFFYAAFTASVGLHVIARKNWHEFDFMRVASQSLSASTAPIGVALVIVATDKTLLPRVTATSGFELYIGLVALLVLFQATGAFLADSKCSSRSPTRWRASSA